MHETKKIVVWNCGGDSKCRIQGVESRIKCFKIGNPGSGVWGAGNWIKNPASHAWDSGNEIWNLVSGVQNPGDRIQVP